MLPVICRCCGGVISSRTSSENVNVCALCERNSWTILDFEDHPVQEDVGVSAAADHLDHFLEVDGPSVVEFTNAVDQAQNAIAEVLAQERESKVQAAAAANRDNTSDVGSASGALTGRVESSGKREAVLRGVSATERHSGAH